jgi:hypothetical protein
MFDQQPEDMFAGTEPAGGNIPPKPTNQVVTGRIGSSLQPNPPAAPSTSPISSEILGQDEPDFREGGNKKTFLIVVAVVVVLALCIGGYFTWKQFSKPSAKVLEGGPSINNVPPVTEEPSVPENTEETPEEAVTPSEENTETIDVDTDMDGIIDDEELNLGTNPMKVDSDDDGLTDREEVQIYNTDPLNPDTDGDTYLDGQEVRGGYDPNGPGKLFELPSNNLPNKEKMTSPGLGEDDKSSFMSENKCTSSMKDCRKEDGYSLCFQGYCSKVGDELKKYIYANYEHDVNCIELACEGCANGKLTPSYINHNGYEINYCIECNGSKPCSDGYICDEVIKKCIKE